MSKFTTFSDEKLNEKYYYLKHESGLDILVIPKEMTLKTALLGVKFGSVYEEGASVDGEIKNFPSGIAHFLEHKLFSNENGVDAMEVLAELGAEANAYTSNNKTVYMFSCTENFENSLAELISFVYNPYFTRKNVNSERGIIGQEIKMCLDSPYDVVSQNLLMALFGDCKLSNDVLGTEKTIAKISDKTLYECYESFYRYSNMALVICGDIDEDSVLQVVNEALPKRDEQAQPILPCIEYESEAASSYIEKTMPISKPIFEIGIKDDYPSKNSSERLKRDVAMTILDEILFSRASELYNELFEGGFINESYSYGYSITRDVAFHSIYGEGDDPKLVLEKIKNYIKQIKQKGLNERDFIRCKRVMMAEFLRDFDSVDDIANSLLNIYFDGSNIFEYRKIIEGVTFSDVCACLENYFDDKCFALSVIKN